VNAMRRVWWIALLGLTGCSGPRADVQIGSKKFTESEVLGELLTQVAETAGVRAKHLDSLGDTIVVWQGLLRGDIDAYVEYTGTLTQDVLANEHLSGEPALRAALEKLGLGMSKPLGFNDSYAIGMRRDRAEQLGINSISDLRTHPGLRPGLSNAFLGRSRDGWEPLRRRYGLPQRTPSGSEHDVSYEALDKGDIDFTDVYTTDAKLSIYKFKLLTDDLHFFPAYDAVIVYRLDLGERRPEVLKKLLGLEGKISADDMVAMNARVDIKGPQHAEAGQVSAEFLAQKLGIHVAYTPDTLTARLERTTMEHLRMVGISLGLAVVIAVPLGIIAAARQRLGHAILAATGVVQTIPALALLMLVYVWLAIAAGRFGIHVFGAPVAIVALFLYSLLPIVRNTYTGLHDVPLPLRESADALGLPPLARLRLVELPMASRSIMAGIKTAAVINIGNATLGGFIAAGGYGQPIFVGLNRNDPGLILEGAIPAVLMALVVQGLFELAERYLVPKGLRLRAAF
jgi:osmoprotectant transport system permease protein